LQEGHDGAKADVFSIGVILFLLLTGSAPFSKACIKDVLFRMISGENTEKFFKFHPKAKKLQLGQEA